MGKRSPARSAAVDKARRFQVTAEGAAREIDWPYGASLQLVIAKGGRKHLTKDEAASLKLRRPKAGQIVTDVPPTSIERLVRCGFIKEVS